MNLRIFLIRLKQPKSLNRTTIKWRETVSKQDKLVNEEPKEYRNKMGKLKRNRKIRTCEYCYSHKLKCDRNSPCSTCIRTKSECVYHFKQFKKENGDESTAKSKKSLKVESHGQGDFEETKVDNARRKIFFKSSASITPLYYSRAFYPFLEPSLNRVLLFKLSEFARFGLSSVNSKKFRGYDSERFGLNLDELADEYPKKEEFDDMIDLYWDYIHPLIPIIDRDTTLANYEKFWREFGDKDEPQFDIDSGVLFLSMLFAVKTAFEVNEKNAKKVEELKRQKNQIYNTFEKFKLAFSNIGNANLSFIQASLILYQSGCIYYIGLFTYTASLARQAEFMGLHRDPLLHDVHPNKDRIKDVEIKRRVWHCIRFLDTATSITAGMSPHMIMTNSSTKFPSKHEYNRETRQFDGELNPFMIYTICSFKSSLVIETVSHYLNSDFSSDEEKQLRWESIAKTVIALYQDIHTLVKEIFSCSNNPKYSNVILRWLVANVATLVHRAYLLHIVCIRRPYSHQNRVILKPFNTPDIGLTKLSRANSNKEFFDKILTIRMPYHPGAIEVSVLLLYETNVRVGMSPELSKFRWFTKSANPFQYIYFVLRDIYHFPTKIYKFTHIPQEIKNFIFDDDLLNCKEDVRKFAVDLSLNALYRLKAQWSAPIVDMMNFLLELRKFIYKSVATRSQSMSNPDNKAESCEAETDSYFEMDKYRSIYNLISTLNEDLSSASNVDPFDSANSFSVENENPSMTGNTSTGDFIAMKYNMNAEHSEFFTNKVKNHPFYPSSPLDLPVGYSSLNLQRPQPIISPQPQLSAKHPLPSLQKAPTIPSIQKMRQMPHISPLHAFSSPPPSIPSMQASYMHPIGTLPPVLNNSGHVIPMAGRKSGAKGKDGPTYDSTSLGHAPSIPNARLSSTISMDGGTSTSSNPP